MISKFKNAQLIFIDGKVPAKIKRAFQENGKFFYEIRETMEIVPETRISLLKK